MALLGILGGQGPKATAYFMELIIDHTEASCDQEHIDMVVYSHASLPDRTAYILGQSKDSPLPLLLKDLKELEGLGATMIVIPCNTSHYFYDDLQKETEVPILNLQTLTAEELSRRGVKSALVLATKGTIETRLYQEALEAEGITPVLPDEAGQRTVMKFIYDDVKAGGLPTKEEFATFMETYDGCEAVILGCTELSVMKTGLELPNRFVDPLEIAARKIIEKFGKKYK